MTSSDSALSSRSSSLSCPFLLLRRMAAEESAIRLEALGTVPVSASNVGGFELILRHVPLVLAPTRPAHCNIHIIEHLLAQAAHDDHSHDLTMLAFTPLPWQRPLRRRPAAPVIPTPTRAAAPAPTCHRGAP